MNVDSIPRVACLSSVILILALLADGGAREPAASPLPEAGVRWDLARDYRIDGKLEDDQQIQSTPLRLMTQGHLLSGHDLDMQGGATKASIFSGEVVTREKPLLILRQDHINRDGHYVVIHTGHLIAANHYRGVWHDNSGQAGDFELRMGQ